MKKKFNSVYQFKVTLEDSKPPIWRRIQVPETYDFWDLHVAIQDAMGWHDCHLHEFEIVNPATDSPVSIGTPYEGVEDILPERTQKVADYFSAENLGPSRFHEVFGSANYFLSKKFRINAYTIYHFDDFITEEKENESWYSGTVFFFYLHRDIMLSVEFFHTEYESYVNGDNENSRGNSIFIHLYWNHTTSF